MDYIVKIEDDHWKCTLFSNMYFCGNLRLRELTLCYIPSPIYRIVMSTKLRESYISIWGMPHLGPLLFESLLVF